LPYVGLQAPQKHSVRQIPVGAAPMAIGERGSAANAGHHSLTFAGESPYPDLTLIRDA
jgi:hypothetical protein